MEETNNIQNNETITFNFMYNNIDYQLIIKLYFDSFEFIIRQTNQIFKNYFQFNNISEQFKFIPNIYTINDIIIFIKKSFEENSFEINIRPEESMEIKLPLNILLILNFQPDSFLKTNIKSILQHTKYITQLSKLKDGRLISSSFDGLLNIYNKETFELELSIKEHNLPILSFNFLNNDNIITCSADETMNIIELKND